MAQGIDKIPLRIPNEWDPKWFEVFVRDVLALLDIRNAVGEGVIISGQSNEVGTITVDADLQDLLLQSFVVAQPSGFLEFERTLAGESGVVQILDGGPDANITVALINGGVNLGKLANLSSMGVLANPVDGAGAIQNVQAEVDKAVLHRSGTDMLFDLIDHTYISDWDEATQDVVGAMLLDSSSINFTYDDTLGSFTADIIDEYVQDLVGAMLVDSASVDFTYDDVAGTFTAAVIPGGVDHGGLAGLGDDDHPQYALHASAETITGLWTYTRNDDWAFIVQSTTPVSLWIDTSPPAADTGKWAMGGNAGEFFILGYNDALSAYRAPYVAARTADYNVDYVQYNATSHRFSLNDRTTRLVQIDVDGSSCHRLMVAAPGTTGSAYVGFYENDLTTRKGHVGYGANGNDFFYVWQEENSLLAILSAGDINIQTTGSGTISMDVGGSTDEWVMANDGSIVHTASVTAPHTITGNINNSFTLLVDNDSNGTANAARISFSSGDANAAFFVTGSGRTSAVITGGPTGAQAVMRTLGAYPLLFGVSNTYVGGFDDNATARNTRLLIYDVDNGQVERVSVGVADSGGAGFKVLRIPN